MTHTVNTERYLNLKPCSGRSNIGKGWIWNEYGCSRTVRLPTPPSNRWPGCRDTSPAHQPQGMCASLPGLESVESFLWGYFNDIIYQEKPLTTKSLKTTITAEAARPPSEMIDRTVSHLQTVRLPELIRRTVAYIEYLL